MSERLSPDRLAEMYRGWPLCDSLHMHFAHDIEEGHCKGILTADVARFRLLRHIEAQQAEIDELKALALRATNDAEFGTANWKRVHDKNKRLEGTVAALREEIAADMEGRQCGGCGQPWAQLQGHSENCPLVQVLADTEAAAWAHDQRVRLEGARELLRRYGEALAHDIAPTSVLRQTLADMEREAGL